MLLSRRYGHIPTSRLLLESLDSAAACGACAPGAPSADVADAEDDDGAADAPLERLPFFFPLVLPPALGAAASDSRLANRAACRPLQGIRVLET